MSDEALALLRDLVAMQRQSMYDLRAIRLALTTSVPDVIEDRQAHIDLLIEIFELFTSQPFATSELVAHAATHSPMLATTIEAIVRPPRIAAKLGRAFELVEGMNLGGLLMVRIGRDRNGAIWQVRQCDSASSQLSQDP